MSIEWHDIYDECLIFPGYEPVIGTLPYKGGACVRGATTEGLTAHTRLEVRVKSIGIFIYAV